MNEKASALLRFRSLSIASTNVRGNLSNTTTTNTSHPAGEGFFVYHATSQLNGRQKIQHGYSIDACQ